MNRIKLGYVNEGKPDSESRSVLSGNDIEQLGIRHVVLLKGDSWKENVVVGIVHRSSYKEGNYQCLYMMINLYNRN